MTTIDSPISELKGIGITAVRLFNNVGVYSIKDLLLTLPYRFEDRSNVVPINQLRFGVSCTIIGRVTSVGARKSRRGVLMISATIEDDSGKVSALWFNQRYLLKYLKREDKHYLYGEKKLLPSLGNPFIVSSIISEPKSVPFYHTVKGLSQKIWNRAITQALIYTNELEDDVAVTYLEESASKTEIIKTVHGEPTSQNLARAERRLAAEELIILALSVLYDNHANNSHVDPIPIDEKFLTSLAVRLPFKLTDGQRKISWQIIKSLAEGKVIHHLLYGEVGSGKTAVAQLISGALIASKRQVAYLCPTTTLATQQYQNFKSIFEPLGMMVSLLTGTSKEQSYASSDIIIGTHALLQKNIALSRLGLVIVDEQHRFGVEQRQLLTNNGKVHLLMMTATPIPRSLAQIIFGQLDISYLLDKPKQQRKITTRVFKENSRPVIEKEITERLRNGEPGYVICPLIVSSQSELLLSERKTIETEERRLKKIFPKFKLEVLHGRLKQAEKDKVMTSFMAGKIDILLSTTVVEVGIDNPNATWILIEEADRFGLSQIHQLRGRVGRGSKASVCYLFNSQTSEYGETRLKAVEENHNGLELAEQDLILRGPGELLGYQQSGLPNLRYANWEDITQVREAFTIAQKILNDGLDNYPKLEKIIKNTINSSL